MAAVDWLIPDWPAAANVGAISTTRRGGVSSGAYASLNLGNHVGDDPQLVAENRRRITALVPADPVWLEQVHGCRVVELPVASAGTPCADAAVAKRPGSACVILTADCLPVLFSDRAGTVVAAAHAGWRGLHAGVLENTVREMRVDPALVLAWFGPAIGQHAFEVGEEVRAAFLQADRGAGSAFVLNERGRWWANLYELARRRLNACGVFSIFGGDHCTFSEADRYFSYRRDGVTGRMASAVWINRPADSTAATERA